MAEVKVYMVNSFLRRKIRVLIEASVKLKAYLEEKGLQIESNVLKIY